MSVLTDRLLQVYERHECWPALRVDTGWLSFGELADRVAAGVRALGRLGVRAGDRVVIAAQNQPELLVADHVLWFAGAVRVALGGRVHGRELARVVADCQPRLVICESSHREQGGGLLAAALPADAELHCLGRPGIEGLPAWLTTVDPDGRAALAAGPVCGDDAPAALMYTSGTTGAPRGAVATHRAWAAMTDGIRDLLPDLGAGDVFGHLAPMSHLGGSVGHALTLAGAAATVPRRSATAGTWSTSIFAAEGITVTAVVPALLRRLLDGPGSETPDAAVPGVRAVVYGGSAASPELIVRANRIFGNVLHQVYGTSEAMVPVTWLSPEQLRAAGAPALTSAGRVTPVAQLAIRSATGSDLPVGETGEIAVRGPTVSPGYRRPDGGLDSLTDADGWYRTGDTGRIDEQGLLFLLGRSKELIVSGGFSIAPAEVESVITALPEVAECVVCAVPDPRWGEGVGAVIRLTPGAVLDAAAVITACRAQLAGHKKPVVVEFVDSLPEGSTGKTDRAAVRARFWSGSGRQTGAE